MPKRAAHWNAHLVSGEKSKAPDPLSQFNGAQCRKHLLPSSAPWAVLLEVAVLTPFGDSPSRAGFSSLSCFQLTGIDIPLPGRERGEPLEFFDRTQIGGVQSRAYQGGRAVTAARYRDWARGHARESRNDRPSRCLAAATNPLARSMTASAAKPPS